MEAGRLGGQRQYQSPRCTLSIPSEIVAIAANQSNPGAVTSGRDLETVALYLVYSVRTGRWLPLPVEAWLDIAEKRTDTHAT